MWHILTYNFALQLAVVLFMRELARRLAPHGIATASTNPGAVVSPLTHGRVDEIVGWTPKVSFRCIYGSNPASVTTRDILRDISSN